MFLNKKAYFQGGGGVNEPTPGKKKYKSDPAIVVQPRFKEPFYRNYDLYTIPGMEDVGPGTGWHGLQNYKSVQEFLKARRERLKPRYVADDSWQVDSGNRVKKNPDLKARAAIFEKIIKTAGPNYDLGKGLYQEMSDGKIDSVEEFREEGNHGPGALMADDVNHIDYPIDDEVNKYELIYPDEGSYHPPTLLGPEGGSGDLSTFPGYTGTTDFSSYIESVDIGGEHTYLPKPDWEDRSGDALDFGRDYTEEAELPGSLNEDDLQELTNKYLEPSETDLFGLPDGIDPISDLDPEQTISDEDPYTGTSDISQQMYEDKWNI